jgi:hypothetical protein
MELQRVERPLSTALKTVESWLGLVGKALVRIGWSQKRTALEIGVPETQFSRQLAGLEHLSFKRMFALPPEFWAEILPLIAEYHGISVGVTKQEAEDAAIGRLVREAVTRSLAR